MATATEFVPNEYLVFEADQVLTNDHLNQLFNYLDQQNRWTRNKLIGVGIVCGLHLVQHTGVIEVGKGCGITSQGYLVIQPSAKQYTYYLPYTGIDQPKDLSFTYPDALPFYKPFVANKTMFSLLTDDEFAALEPDAKSSAQTISSANASNLLNDYAVVLFAEAGEQDLKNCDTFDCNNKGEKMTLNLRALLVRKADLPSPRKDLPVTPPIRPMIPVFNVLDTPNISSAFVRKNAGSTLAENVVAGRATTSSAATGRMLNTDISISLPFPVSIFLIQPPEISLKRFNVPYTDLQSTDDVINAFATLVDDSTLSSVATAFGYCFGHYKDVLDDGATGFPTLFNDLKAQRDLILQKNPVFIQYFYDFIDDLVKAYYEFRSKVSLLLSACCPDENMFPLHLVLGAATANTKDFAKDRYRTYFMYSPLFARQENEISEIQFLYRRMQILVSEFTMIAPDDISTAAVKILPSYHQAATLSQRAIPYYYSVNEPGNELYKYWNYSKTIRSDETLNLSYNAAAYTNSIITQNPLLYDIEKNDFFRIEGHIGTNYQAALTNILQQKKTYNLPFDVVAVSADQLVATTGALPQCNVQDLDTDFKLMVTEFACKVHIPFCFITKMTNPPVTMAGTGGIFTGGIFTGGIFMKNVAAESKLTAEDANVADDVSRVSFNTFKLTNAITDKVLINPNIFRIGYQKGDFMRKYCQPSGKTVTIGSVYLASIKNGVFTNPVPLRSQSGINIYYYQLFEYVDAVESLMQVLMPATLTTIDVTAFSNAYQHFADSLYQVTVAAAEINNPQTGTANTDVQNFLKDIETDMLVNELSAPVYDCIDERLQTLISEYASRLQQYQNQLNFLSYYNKHSGLEHKGGVPKGGTFVLVYRPAAPVATTTDTATGINTNTETITPTLPKTGGFFNPGIINTGIINSGILKTGVLKTSGIKNPVVTGARLFMAKAPKRTLDKSVTRIENANAEEETGDAIQPKDITKKEVVPVTGFGIGTTGQTPVIKATSTPVRAEQPTLDTAATGAVTPIRNIPVVEQPVKPVIDTATATALQPDVITETAAASQLNAVSVGAAVSATSQPVIVPTRPIPVPADTIQPVITKPFEPVVISTRPTGSVKGSSSIPILTKPVTFPVITNFPTDTGTTVNQPATPSRLDQSTMDLISNFANASADLSSDNRKTILDFLKGANQQLAASKFNIADNVVIADFYIPYLCCSDCAPVTYIVQQPAPTPPPQQAPTFDITPKEFLFDDTANYPFTATPLVTDTGKATDPFASDAILNPGNLHLLTDANNTLFLVPAMPNLTVTTTATVAYHNLPVDITIIKPDASFALDVVTDDKGNAALQVSPNDNNADTYKWTVNEVEGIFENTKTPAAVSIDDIRNKVQSSPFTIALTASYTRNDKTSADTRQQVYQPSVCIDFDAFEPNKVFGAQANQKEGDIAFTTTEKIEASVFQFTFPADKAFGSAFITKTPGRLGDGGQCLQMDTMAMKFDYTKTNLKPEQVTIAFLVVGGIINLAVNDSDVYTGDISKLPDQFKDVKVSIYVSDMNRAIVMTGRVDTFLIGGQQIFIDNICVQ